MASGWYLCLVQIRTYAVLTDKYPGLSCNHLPLFLSGAFCSVPFLPLLPVVSRLVSFHTRLFERRTQRILCNSLTAEASASPPLIGRSSVSRRHASSARQIHVGDEIAWLSLFEFVVCGARRWTGTHAVVFHWPEVVAFAESGLGTHAPRFWVRGTAFPSSPCIPSHCYAVTVSGLRVQSDALLSFLTPVHHSCRNAAPGTTTTFCSHRRVLCPWYSHLSHSFGFRRKHAGHNCAVSPHVTG